MKTPNHPIFWKLANGLAAANVAAYRATGGKLGGRVAGGPVLLLHHRGRKTGKERVSPLLFLDDGDRTVIVASKGGTQRNPAWFHNLTAMDSTVIELGRERRTVRPRVANPEERAELWPRVVAMYGGYADYQRQTDREIPVVILDPIGSAA